MGQIRVNYSVIPKQQETAKVILIYQKKKKKKDAEVFSNYGSVSVLT